MYKLFDLRALSDVRVATVAMEGRGLCNGELYVLGFMFHFIAIGLLLMSKLAIQNRDAF